MHTKVTILCMTLRRCGKHISRWKPTFEWDAHRVEHHWPYINKTLLSANQYSKSHLSNTVPAFCSGYRQAQISHLTDIWSISAPITLFIFCSMWVEKTFRYHWDSHSPQLDHSPPAGVVKYHDLIICADLIPSSWRHAISFKETLPVETLRRLLCHCSSFAGIHSPKQRWSTASQQALKPTERKWERNETIKKLHHQCEIWEVKYDSPHQI